MRIEKLSAGLAKMESYRLIRSVRAGLTIAIPILMIGSFSLLIRTFAGYFPALIFIEELAELLYQCTFGILSVLLTGCLAWGALQTEEKPLPGDWIVPPAAIMVFIILNGGLKLESAGAVGTFTAVCAAFFTSFTYCWLRRKMPAEHFFAPGADYNFNQAFTAILPMLAVLLFAFERGSAFAIPAALCIGLGMDLGAGGGSFVHAASYAFSAVLVNVTARGNRVVSALWFALSILCFALPMNAHAGLVLLYEGLAATLLFLLIPSRFLRGKRLCSDEAAQEDAAVRRKIAASAAALRELYDSIARPRTLTEENPAAIFDRAAEKVCRGCALCSYCWEKEYQRTYTALNDATAALLRRGQGRGEDFPSYFSERCIHFSSFLSAVNGELRAYLLRRQYRRLLEDDRAKAASQYAQLSELMQSAADGALRPVSTQPMHSYEIGLSLRPKRGERVSGDSAAHFETEDGTLCLLLSDGMGCGEAAQRESSMAARLLERFLSAGIDAPPALKTLNSALSLRAESTDSFTTVDLLTLSLQTLEGELYKYGAAPSYLKRGGTVRRVTCSCLPAGLQEGSPPPEATHIKLSPGCFFVMLSDGVADSLDDEWLQNLLAGWEGHDPQQLVAAILADSMEKRGGTDDAGVLALYIPEGSGGAQAV